MLFSFSHHLSLLSIFFKHACPSPSSTCILQRTITLQKRKDGQFADQATLEWSAFIPLTIQFTVNLFTCFITNSFYNTLNCQSVDNTHNTPGYSGTQVRFPTLFQFTCRGTYVQCTILSFDPQNMSSTGNSWEEIISSKL